VQEALASAGHKVALLNETPTPLLVRCEVSFADGIAQTIAWYKAVEKDWWPIGTDSALAPHPKPSGASNTTSAELGSSLH